MLRTPKAKATALLTFVFLTVALCLSFFAQIPGALRGHTPSWSSFNPTPSPSPLPSILPPPPVESSEEAPVEPSNEEPKDEKPPWPRYKPPLATRPPLKENFPLAAHASSPSDLPPIPSWNIPPDPHVDQSTPLFIGFTRNWAVLQQAVVSYITAGWPASDIYVIDNTGTQSSNRDNLLTLQNPFYLDYQRLIEVYGVNVVSTPTYLTFAQLQNYFIWLAGEHGWGYYFWSHQDVVALSDEEYVDKTSGEYKSLYHRVLDTLHETLAPSYGRWAIRFFAYDHLTLVNRTAYMDVGGWDSMIPYYGTDCDMHERIAMKNYKIEDAKVGLIYDVASSLDDLLVLYRRKTPIPTSVPPPSSSSPAPLPPRSPISIAPSDTLASSTYKTLINTLDSIQTWKSSNPDGRNIWQNYQRGGQGEPFYVDPEGFETSIWRTVELGKEVMSLKWGHRGCDIIGVGLQLGDAWRVEKDGEWS